MNAVTPGDAPLYRWQFEDCEFDEARQELRVHGSAVAMEPRPLQVLAELLRHAGEVVTKQELFDSVWAGRPTVDHVLSTAVGKLRRAFGEAGERLIQTVPRHGYRFDGKVTRIAVGRRLASGLALEAGRAIPGRPHFVLERQLGHPRGSEIWLARHAKTRQPRVFKFALDADQLSALKRETTIARVLRETLGERDDFVRIVDWNFAEPPFFIEAEYAGSDLLTWSEQVPDLATWTLEQRIAFFLPVADAVADAHGIGVLHKDLKPANVLVHAADGGGWRVRLGDFGCGHLLQPERVAAMGISLIGMTHGSVVNEASGGTLLYLAPELVAGGTPTVQSDVYALGILLYQIVAGDLRKPIATGWERDVADPLLREDIARATHGDARQRLTGAAELAEHLRRLPARRAEKEQRERIERSERAAREALERAHARRPWIIASVVLLAIGFTASLWQFLQADQARLRAEQAVARSESIQHFLRDDILGAANPQRRGFSDPTVNDLLERAQASLQGRFAGDPRLRAELRDTLAASFAGLGKLDAALENYRLAAREYESLPDGAALLQAAHYDQARILALQHRYDEARRMLDEADAASAALRPSSPALALHAALAHAMLHYQQVETRPAMEFYRQAEQLQRAVRPDDPAMAMMIRLRLVDGHMRLGDIDAAERLLRTMLDDPVLSEGMVGKGATANIHLMLARVLRRRHQFDDALAEANRALALIEDAYGTDGRDAGLALSVVSSIHSDLDQCEPAIATATRAVATLRKTDGDTDQGTLVEIGNLGLKESYCDRLPDALRHLVQAEQGLVTNYGADLPLVQSFRYAIARVLAELGRDAEALGYLDDLSAAALQASTATPGWNDRLDGLRGRILVRTGRREEGLALLQATLERTSANGDPAEVAEDIRSFLSGHGPTPASDGN